MKGKSTNSPHKSVCALVLPGGGARAAYQIGVLKAISEFTPGQHSPFPIICGTSAGAINAAVLASHAHEYALGVARLEQFWASMYCARIYRTDAWSVFKSGLHWMLALMSGGLLNTQPKSLLDTGPLRHFLNSTLKLGGISTAIEQKALRGIAITASAYSRASAVSFYQGAEDIEPWQRARRLGQPSEINVSHLLASAALPFIFPAEKIQNEYYGDGGMRMIAPLSPAIHLGADRILIIGTRDEKPDPEPESPGTYPSLGEVGGYLLDTIFMDTLNADMARLNRINHTLDLIPEQQRSESKLKNIQSLLIRPSRDLRHLTKEYADDIPTTVRMLLRTMGGWGKDWRMASYLLFEANYCQQLMSLGYDDGMREKEKILNFVCPNQGESDN
jgi:NTE family protein